MRGVSGGVEIVVLVRPQRLHDKNVVGRIGTVSRPSGCIEFIDQVPVVAARVLVFSREGVNQNLAEVGDWRGQPAGTQVGVVAVRRRRVAVVVEKVLL